ncbi:hypothetical phage protein [Campylobacter phage CP220]|uniref:Hypothetical phage protein n=1 Tax=Campylobacter phage CP220 TaxID=2994044 RepID=D5GV71_9CAUD|nr:hypothetical protein APL47_gp079 [Campylobacter phage CP220]CBJ93888.1 hypothetical phage protein [Campylobacter phage CP220]
MSDSKHLLNNFGLLCVKINILKSIQHYINNFNLFIYYTAKSEPKNNTIIVKTTHNNIAIVIEPMTLTKYKNINVYKTTTNIAIDKTNNPVKNLSINFSKENSLKILQI